MEKERSSRSDLFGNRKNVKLVFMVIITAAVMLAGFFAGVLYGSTQVASDAGLEWGSLAVEANYVIMADNENIVYARNGFSGRIDYNSTNAAFVINSVLEALDVTGGTIFIREGTYTLSETIKVPSDVALVGAGFSSKLVLANGSNINIMENSDRGHGNENMLIAHLHLDGNRAENTAKIGGGISFTKVRNTTIQNLWVHDVGYSGLLLYNGGGNVIRNNFVYNNTNAGIEGTTEDHDIVANNVVYSNLGDPYGHGIDYCTGSRYNIFEGNVLHNNGLASGGGLALWDGFENSIQGNTITSNFVGITVGIPSFGNKTHGNIVTGNVVSNNTNDGLHVEGENNLVSKNTFSFNRGNGVYINSSKTKNTIIEGNHFENNQKWQIHVAGGLSDTIIENNFFFGNNPIKDEGTNTTIRWNFGYNTENGGTVVIPAQQTNVSFEHDLVSVPARVNLTPKDNLGGRSFWYTANSTHIIIYTSSPDPSNSHSFDWSAQT